MNKKQKEILLHAFLFVATFITTTIGGASLVYGRSFFGDQEPFTWTDFVNGMWFSVPLMLILTVHEFGHYFAAVYHNVKSSLPYFIPVPPGLIFTIGTLGAVIRLRSRPKSNVQQFDIGIAGPLAGFVVAMFFFVYALQTIPPPQDIYRFHPEYERFGLAYADSVYSPEFIKKQFPELKGHFTTIKYGQSLLFVLGEKLLSDSSAMPNGYEIMHYPVLLAVFVGLLITAMNLFPIGQLDGGHIIYGLFGEKNHFMIARAFFLLLLLYAGTGLLTPQESMENLLIFIPAYLLFLFGALKRFELAIRDRIMLACLIFAFQFTMAFFFPSLTGYPGWLLFAFIIGAFLGIRHPPSLVEQHLDPGRIVIGWIALIIFVLCFMPAPLVIEQF